MITPHPSPRLLAIGDIHGYLDELQQLLALVQPKPDDKVVFLGDYIDRGPDSQGVLNELIRFGERFPQTVFLRGNHEQMFMDALDWHEIEQRQARTDLSTDDWHELYTALRERAGFFGLQPMDLVRIWLREGGLETLASYDGAIDNVRPEQRAFLNATQIFHEERLVGDGEGTPGQGKGFLFVHAGADLKQSPSTQHPLLLMNDRRFPEPGKRSHWTLVHGHTIQLDGPLLKPKRINLDTGIYLAGGRLTCCDVIRRQFWQVPRHRR